MSRFEDDPLYEDYEDYPDDCDCPLCKGETAAFPPSAPFYNYDEEEAEDDLMDSPYFDAEEYW